MHNHKRRMMGGSQPLKSSCVVLINDVLMLYSVMPYHFSLTPKACATSKPLSGFEWLSNLTILPTSLVEELRLRARFRSTHFSTRIEGNRLSLVEAEQVIIDGRAFQGRERDALEVKHTFQALEQVEAWVDGSAALTEERVRKLHAVIYQGKRARPTPLPRWSECHPRRHRNNYLPPTRSRTCRGLWASF